MSSPPAPRRGEVWDADLDSPVGHEQGDIRLVLVVSDDRFNDSRTQICIVVALTSTDRGLWLHVPVTPPEGGVAVPSVVQPEQVRAISYDRLIRRRGRVDPVTLRDVVDRLHRLIPR